MAKKRRKKSKSARPPCVPEGLGSRETAYTAK